MNPTRRAVAAAEILLIMPAVLFMAALVVRRLGPLAFEPARTAQQVVMWYAERPFVGLWLLLIALPLAALAIGGATLARGWAGGALRQAVPPDAGLGRAHGATLLVAATTAAAAVILAVVAAHMLAN